MQEEPFSNPIAPPTSLSSGNKKSVGHPQFIKTSDVERQNLSNEDFRKLLMTPRSGSSTTGPTRVLGSVRGARKSIVIDSQFKIPPATPSRGGAGGTGAQADSADRKKAKKKFHTPHKNEEEERLSELSKQYRDRAKERRQNANPDYEVDEDPLAALAYQSVAPPPSMTINVEGTSTLQEAAQRRRQLIEESKFLGGDMKHTHLVKGLDYALLHKVKAELDTKDEEDLERISAEIDRKADELADTGDQEEFTIRSAMARNVINTVLKQNRPKKNELFSLGRMAYVFELEDVWCADDVPTSIIRSKADLPNWESNSSLSTNDIVINKLISIFNELRQGGKRRRKDASVKAVAHATKSENETVSQVSSKKEPSVQSDIGIYDEDIGDYELPQKRIRKLSEEEEDDEDEEERSRDRRSSRDSRSLKNGSDFDYHANNDRSRSNHHRHLPRLSEQKDKRGRSRTRDDIISGEWKKKSFEDERRVRSIESASRDDDDDERTSSSKPARLSSRNVVVQNDRQQSDSDSDSSSSSKVSARSVSLSPPPPSRKSFKSNSSSSTSNSRSSSVASRSSSSGCSTTDLRSKSPHRSSRDRFDRQSTSQSHRHRSRSHSPGHSINRKEQRHESSYRNRRVESKDHRDRKHEHSRDVSRERYRYRR